MKDLKLLFILLFVSVLTCGAQVTTCNEMCGTSLPPEMVIVGAERTGEYLPLLKGKRIALLSNQTGVVGIFHNKHTLDLMLEMGLNVTTIFCIMKRKLSYNCSTCCFHKTSTIKRIIHIKVYTTCMNTSMIN